MSSVDEENEADSAYGMETFNWRGDNPRSADVNVKGGAEVAVSTSSQEGIIAETVSSGEGIVKTTQFTVEEQDAENVDDGEKWSNV